MNVLPFTSPINSRQRGEERRFRDQERRYVGEREDSSVDKEDTVGRARAGGDLDKEDTAGRSRACSDLGTEKPSF